MLSREPYNYAAPRHCLEDLQSAISLSPLPALSPEHLRHQGRQLGPCDSLIYLLRFLRFCAMISVKRLRTRVGGWIRSKTPTHKARVAVGSPPYAPLNGITELFDQPLLLPWGEKRLSENRGHLQPHHTQLRKKRNKINKEPVWRSSTGASGLAR